MKRQRGGANNVNNNNNNNNNNNGVGVGSSSMNAPNKVEDMAVVGSAVAAMGKKRSKKDQGEQSNNKRKSVVEEEMTRTNKESKEVVIGAGDHHQHQPQSSVMGWNSNFSWEEYMPWVGGVDDEQMSWGTTWFPGWDMDFMGEAFSALYSDVVWDDDIWNLRKEIPIPLDSNRIG